jgi:hypothetical protein
MKANAVVLHPELNGDQAANIKGQPSEDQAR